MILMLCDAKRELIMLCKDTVIMEKSENSIKINN